MDRSLFEDFMRARDKCRGALVALNERLMMMNASAAEVLDPAERPRLWKLAKTAAAQGSPVLKELPLRNGKSVMASHRPVVRDGVAIGVLVQFSVTPKSPSAPSIDGEVDPDPTGWEDLTRTEREVARVVASGLTNREAGRRVFMSPHTVDAHLRHIFRKLNINSRVELARIVGEYRGQLPGSADHEEARARSLHPSHIEQPRLA
jgi:DNA-binding CsgD family transcriptional regulator